MNKKHLRVAYLGMVLTVIGIKSSVAAWIVESPGLNSLSLGALIIGLVGLAVSFLTGLKIRKIHTLNIQAKAALMKHRRLSIALMTVVSFMVIVRFFIGQAFLSDFHPPYFVLSLISLMLLVVVKRFGKSLRQRKSSL